VVDVPSGQLSCPDCGARAAAHARACAGCGFRFLEDRPRGRAPARPPTHGLVLAAGLAVVAIAAAVLLLKGGDQAEPGAAAAHSGPEVLSAHPLSNRAAERRLEERFTSSLDDDTAGAHCGPLEPRPAHAIRHCRIVYPGGTERDVVVLTNPEGHELLVDPQP
jgi:hypothetical protein